MNLSKKVSQAHIQRKSQNTGHTEEKGLIEDASSEKSIQKAEDSATKKAAQKRETGSTRRRIPTKQSKKTKPIVAGIWRVVALCHGMFVCEVAERRHVVF